MRSKKFGWTIVILAAAGVALCGWASTAQAGTYTWNVADTVGGDWNTDGNWDASGFPDAIDDVARIGNKKNYVDLSADATIGELEMYNQGTYATTNITTGTSKKLVFDVSTGQAKITLDRGTNISAGVTLNDDILLTIGGNRLTLSGPLAGSKDIYIEPNMNIQNSERIIISGDTSGFTGDIYLQAQTTPGEYAILNTNSLGAGDLTSTTIYMGQDSIIDAARNGGGVVAADIVLQGDAKFMSNGNKGGFKTTGVISGSGDLTIDRANGGPTLEISGTAPNTFTGDVDVYKNTAGGRLMLSKDGALGLAPTLSIGDDIELYITSSGGVEDRIWDSTVVSIEGNIDADAIYGRFNLASSVSETVDQLWIDGLQIDAGTYNSASPETLNHITGAGELVVLSGPGGVIPEPSTFAIWALGLLGLGWYARRKRK